MAYDSWCICAALESSVLLNQDVLGLQIRVVLAHMKDVAVPC
jgi:hypothetical protein